MASSWQANESEEWWEPEYGWAQQWQEKAAWPKFEDELTTRMFTMFDSIKEAIHMLNREVDAVDDITEKLNMLTDKVDAVDDQLQYMKEDQADLVKQQAYLVAQVGLAHEQLQEIQERDARHLGVQDASISVEKVEQLLPEKIDGSVYKQSQTHTGASHFQKQKGRGRARLRLRLRGPTAAVQAMRVIGTVSAISSRSKP